MKLTLKQLRYFVAVAEELHFTRAAERVFLSQPALSQQIRRIEESVGLRLLERDKRKVSLTEAGTLILEHARLTLAQADQLAGAARQAAGQSSAHLRVAYVDASNLPFIAPAVRELRERHPKLQIEHLEMYPNLQRQALLDHEIDVAFAPLPLSGSSLESLPLLTTNWAVRLPGHHPLAALDDIPLEQLRDLPLIVYSEALNPPVFHWFKERCREAGFEPIIAFEVGHSSSATAFVLEEVGVFVAHSSRISDAPPGIAMRPLSGFDSTMSFGAVWRRDNPSGVLRDFIGAVRSTAIKNLVS